MTQHYHSPPRDHQNQHTQKCSVHTRRCLALQCTLISCSSSSFCSTGLSVTSPRSRSESIFIPLQASGTTCVVSSILVCFFLGLLQLFTFCFSQPRPRSPQHSELSPIAPVFLEVTHTSLHLTSPSRFSPPCLIASLASCPEYLMAAHVTYSFTTPFSTPFLLFCHPTF